MEIILKIKKFIKKLQELPENQRYVILWIIIGTLGIIFIIVWFKMVEQNFKKIDVSNFFPKDSSIENSLIVPDNNESIDNIDLQTE